jgi:hypothetical protein
MLLDEYESELLDGIEQLERRLRELDNQQKGAAENKVEGEEAMDIHSKRQKFLYGEAGDDCEKWMEKYAKLKELYDAQVSDIL